MGRSRSNWRNGLSGRSASGASSGCRRAARRWRVRYSRAGKTRPITSSSSAAARPGFRLGGCSYVHRRFPRLPTGHHWALGWGPDPCQVGSHRRRWGWGSRATVAGPLLHHLDGCGTPDVRRASPNRTTPSAPNHLRHSLIWNQSKENDGTGALYHRDCVPYFLTGQSMSA